MIYKTVILAGITTIATVASNTIAQTHQIFWDSSNDLFQSERKPTKQVRLGDRLDFTCGHDTNLGNAYLVNDLHSFENCDSSSRQVLFNCEKAGTKKTIKILEVNPHPFAPIFLAGQDYYLVGGSCAHENLRMIIRVDAEVSSDGLARVVTEEIEIEQPEIETIYPETPRVVIPVITTNSESLSEEPMDNFSANNTQLNQLLIGVALGVLIFLILVFSSILIYLKFCGAKNKSKKNKVNDVENSSESGIGYTFKQAPIINTIPSFTNNEKTDQLYKFNNYQTDFKTEENVQSLITTTTKKSYVPPSLVKPWFMYQNRENNLQNFQNPNFSNNQYLQTIQHQNQQQFHSQTIQNHYQSQFRKPKATTQTYTNLPVSRQMVGEPSMTGNAFLSIAKRVDPAYAHDLSQEVSQEIISHNFTQNEYNQSNNFVQNNKFGSIDSGKHNSQNESSRGSSEPLINASRDVGYEGSQEVTSSPETESSQISPQSGFKPTCQPRLENGGLVISV